MGTLSYSNGKHFGYTGAADSCLWCGDPLRHRRIAATDADQENATYQANGNYSRATIVAPTAGPYGDGHFCSLRCGFQFGVRLADLGRRLAPISTATIPQRP